MNRETREKLEAWLRYYDDLGIRFFYRDRLAAPLTSVESEPAATSAWHPPTPPATQTASLPIVQAPSLFETIERVEGDTLERIREDIGDCTRCRLHRRRTRRK